MRLRVGHQHSQFWPILARLLDYHSLFWGPSVISTTDEPQGAFTCRLSTLAILAKFWFISCTITHHFVVLEQFPRLTIPRVHLRVGYKHSQFWPILVHFVHYYSPFWGPRAISTIEDPRDAFTSPSSIVTVLANSDSFHGLLLTVLGSEGIFIVVEPRGALTCRS